MNKSTFCEIKYMYMNGRPAILNETSKPPVNKTHFFNIANLLLGCLK